MVRTVFLIDEDPDRLAMLTAQLERGRAFVTKGFASASDALDAVAAQTPDLVVCNALMPGIDGVLFAELLTTAARKAVGPHNVVQIPRGLTLAEVESLYIQATLDEVDGRVNEAADRLGVTRKVLWSRRKRYGLLDPTG